MSTIEQRRSARFFFTLEGIFYHVNGEHRIETRDISAGGAFFKSPENPAKNTVVKLLLWIKKDQDGEIKSYPVDVSAFVVRALKYSAEDEGENGFAVRWLTVSCKNDSQPLKEFLKGFLGIGYGFITIQRPSEAEKVYMFKFPEAEKIMKTIQEASGEKPVPKKVDTPAREPSGTSNVKKRVMTGVYVSIPITFMVGDQTFAGVASKIADNGMRIDTDSPIPQQYERISIKLTLETKRRKVDLNLNGTVTIVKPLDFDLTSGGSFEVEFGIGNDPVIVNIYRKVVEQLKSTVF
ncbi:MAG: PilZ domain-containing protein [Deltaproteobacteria bacterium]|nr:PilZ domain-containing protein [Deltaproteobacteria bacterium]